MNSIVLRHLLKYCRKHELDIQEIDSEINYEENKTHLETLGGKSEAQLMREYQSQYDQYRHEHILEDYVMAEMEGKTKSEQTVSLDSRFSLSEWVKRHFWGEKRIYRWAVLPSFIRVRLVGLLQVSDTSTNPVCPFGLRTHGSHHAALSACNLSAWETSRPILG